jgi:hypothetical protein
MKWQRADLLGRTPIRPRRAVSLIQKEQTSMSTEETFARSVASLLQALKDRKTLCYVSDDPNIIAGFRSFARKIGGEFRIEHVGPLTKLMIIPPRSGLGRR